MTAACVALAIACGQDGPSPALRVGPITYSEAELGSLGAEARADLATLAGFGLAIARGVVGPLVDTLVDAALDSATVSRLLDDAALRRSGLSEAEIAAAYRADPELELTVRHLVVLADEDARGRAEAEARARAVIARNRILGGEDFARVAAEVSEEPGAASRGGLLEPGRRGDWVAPFWEAAAELEPGEVSEVVRTRYGFHVLRLEAKRPLPLEEVRRDVAGRLVPDGRGAPAARAWADSIADASGAAALVREARLRGLGPTQEERETARAAALAEVSGWALALGFEAAADAEDVARRALEVLASERQGVALARAAVLRHRDAVDALYSGDSPGSTRSSEAVHADTSP